MAARNGAGVGSDRSELVDEAQTETRKSQVTWKVFRFEHSDDAGVLQANKDAAAALAAAYKESQTDKLWSDVGHTDTAYYTGYCLAGELATKAVTLAGEYYKMKVPLTAGYTLGRNWAETH